jgi:ABC-type uncharacterized transport system substrate-binding protein
MDLDLIAVNSTPASQAMRKATTSKDLPVVFMRAGRGPGET